MTFIWPVAKKMTDLFNFSKITTLNVCIPLLWTGGAVAYNSPNQMEWITNCTDIVKDKKAIVSQRIIEKLHHLHSYTGKL